MLNWTSYLAFLVAPTESQRWEATKEIFAKVSPTDFHIYHFWYKRSSFGNLER